MEPDFSGWATKANIKCSDGRTISPNAFQHQDKVKVPLVWQHGHTAATNVLGHAVLEARPEGIYTKAYFNDTPTGLHAKGMVTHGDIDKLSIYANQLVEKSKNVLHGMIREVSLVLAGANPGAIIDFVAIKHGDGDVETLEDEAVIHTGLMIENIRVEEPQTDDSELEHKSVQEVIDSMSEEQQDVLHTLVAKALEEAGSAEHAETDDSEEEKIIHQEGTPEVKHRNVFEVHDESGNVKTGPDGKTLTHEITDLDIKSIFQAAQKGGSLRHAVEEYALSHGITNIDMLFPDAQTLQDRPEFRQRRVDWVTEVMNGTHHSPFSRVKTQSANLTLDSARAKGYVKGAFKKEEWFSITERITTPTTIYKKQKLDRDDMLDVTSFDIVAWIKAEMRLMIEEEIARAILIGDGRDASDADKIKEPAATVTEGAGIRSILNDNELYAYSIYVLSTDVAAANGYDKIIDAVVRARRYYHGSGSPTLFTTAAVVAEFMLIKDGDGRRIYRTRDELAAALMVNKIVEVEVMETLTGVYGILVNLADYNVGTDRGGELTTFDDFDIDYNQYKWLIETRLSGALTKLLSAAVIRGITASSGIVIPNAPTYNSATGVVTIPTQTGVVYKSGSTTGSTLTAGAQTALTLGQSLAVFAVPATNYQFPSTEGDNWTYERL